MEDFLTLIIEPLREVYIKFKTFFPNFLAMVIIVSAGIVLAWIVRALLIRILKAIHFDSWSDRMGLTVLMRKGDMWIKPSTALGGIAFWAILIVACMAGLNALKIATIENLVNQFFLYLPRATSAIAILILGYIVAGFVGRAVLITAVNSGYHYAKLLAEAVRLLLMVLILSMALEQLQIAPNIVVAAFSILFGGIVAALAIAFGVGGIEAARRMIEKESENKGQEKHDLDHL